MTTGLLAACSIHFDVITNALEPSGSVPSSHAMRSSKHTSPRMTKHSSRIPFDAVKPVQTLPIH